MIVLILLAWCFLGLILTGFVLALLTSMNLYGFIICTMFLSAWMWNKHLTRRTT